MTLFRKRTRTDGAAPGDKLRFGWGDSAAWFTSLGIHVLLLLSLAAASLVIPNDAIDLALSYMPPELPEEEEPLPQEFLSSNESMEDFGALNQASVASAQAMALEIDENNVDALVDLSVLYGRMMHRYVKAAELAGRALEIEPDNPAAREQLFLYSLRAAMEPNGGED